MGLQLSTGHAFPWTFLYLSCLLPLVYFLPARTFVTAWFLRIIFHAPRRQQWRSGCQVNGPKVAKFLDLFMKVLRVLCPNLTDDPAFVLPLVLGLDAWVFSLHLQAWTFLFQFQRTNLHVPGFLLYGHVFIILVYTTRDHIFYTNSNTFSVLERHFFLKL